MKQSSALPKIKRAKTLDEVAYGHIKRAIITGGFDPGTFLAEVQLAQELGISKTPVREAMRRLQQERFLVNIPFEGYYAADISVHDILEMYQLRQLLECFLVRETVDMFSEGELDDLQSTLDAADEALATGNPERFVDLNRTFHHAFDRKYDNQRISDVLTNLDEHVQRILLYEFRDQPHYFLTSHQEHYLILGAIRERDKEAAEHLVKQHLSRFCVLAGGADTPQLASLLGVDVPLGYSFGATLITEPIAPVFQQVALIHTPRDLDIPLNIRQLSNGSLMIHGGSHGGMDDRSLGKDDAEVQDVMRAATRVLPQLEGVKIIEERRGRRPLPQDGHPILGFSPSVPNLYVAAMHSGVTLAPLVGECVAIEILDDVEIELLEPYRLARFHRN